MSWNPDTDAILLFAHGSRAADLKHELRRICEMVREGTGLKIVEVAFLELQEPDLYFGIKTCASQGAARVVVVPYLLNVGTHVRKDLPELLARAREGMPELEIRLAPHLGVDALMAQLVAKRAAEAKAGEDPL